MLIRDHRKDTMARSLPTTLVAAAIEAAASRVVVAAAAVALVVALGLAGPASAHTDLIASAPPDGGTLVAAPETVELRFNEEISAQWSTVTLRVAGEDLGELAVRQGETPSSLVAVVPLPDIQRLYPRGRSGQLEWRASYRVTSTDGHPVEGSLEFEAPSQSATNAASDRVGGGSPTAEPGADESERAGSAAGTEGTQATAGTDGSTATLVLGGLAAACVALGFVLLVRARRRSPQW